MTAFRQQRRRNNRRPVPGQIQPAPRILPLQTLILGTGATSGIAEIRVDFQQTVILTGIPRLLINGSLYPLNATGSGSERISCEIDSAVAVGSQIVIPDSDPAWRGENGEWIAGCLSWLGSATLGQPPIQIAVDSIVRDDATHIIVTLLSEPADPITNWTAVIVAGGNVTASTMIDLSTYRLTAPGPIMVGSSVQVPAWSVGGLGVIEFVAPISTGVLA